MTNTYTEYKVGDRVKYIGKRTLSSSDRDLVPGYEGNVVWVDIDSCYPIQVKFDNPHVLVSLWYLELSEIEIVSRKITYPIHHTPYLIQFDERVFVWFDEVGIASGASPSLEQAVEDQVRYIQNTLAEILSQ